MKMKDTVNLTLSSDECVLVREALEDKRAEYHNYFDMACNQGNQEMIDFWLWEIDSINHIIDNLG